MASNMFNGTWNPNAPPSFTPDQFQYVANPYGGAGGWTDANGNLQGGFQDAGGQTGQASSGKWTTPLGGFNQNNVRFYGGMEGNTDPNGFNLQIKNGSNTGMVYQYTRDPATGNYVPKSIGQQAMNGNTAYGSDFWMPLALTVGAPLAAYAGGALASAEGGAAGGGGVVAGSQPAYMGVGTVGAGAAGEGAAAGGAAAGTGTAAGTGAGSGSLLNQAGDWVANNPQSAVQLGSLLYGAYKGATGGNSNGTGGGSNPYAGTSPMTPLSQLMPRQQAPVLPNTASYPTNSPSAQMWSQYVTSLFGGGGQGAPAVAAPIKGPGPTAPGTGALPPAMPPRRTGPLLWSGGY